MPRCSRQSRCSRSCGLPPRNLYPAVPCAWHGWSALGSFAHCPVCGSAEASRDARPVHRAALVSRALPADDFGAAGHFSGRRTCGHAQRSFDIYINTLARHGCQTKFWFWPHGAFAFPFERAMLGHASCRAGSLRDTARGGVRVCRHPHIARMYRSSMPVVACLHRMRPSYDGSRKIVRAHICTRSVCLCLCLCVCVCVCVCVCEEHSMIRCVFTSCWVRFTFCVFCRCRGVGLNVVLPSPPFCHLFL